MINPFAIALISVLSFIPQPTGLVTSGLSGFVSGESVAIASPIASNAQRVALEHEWLSESHTKCETIGACVKQRSQEATVAGANGRFVGQVLVNGNRETAWAVLTDYNNFPNFLSNVERCQVLRRQGNQVVFEQIGIVRVSAFTRRSRLVISALHRYPDEISFSAIEGDVESLQGTWRIIPQPNNQVLISNQVTVDPGQSNLRGVFFSVYRNELRNTLTALKQEIERRGRR